MIKYFFLLFLSINTFNLQSQDLNKIDLTVEDDDEDITIPFSVIDNPPIFPGCESYKSKIESKNCFNKKLSNYLIEKLENEPKIQGSIMFGFTILKNGGIRNFRYRGPRNISFQEKLQSIIESIKFTPGKERDKYVNCNYTYKLQ